MAQNPSVSQSPSASHQIPLQELLKVLEGSGLGIRTHGPLPSLALLSPGLYDPTAALESLPGGILLGIGLRADDERTAAVVQEAARAGFAAIVLKADPESAGLEALAGAADRAGIALLVVADEVSWRQLDGLIESAVGTLAEANSSLVPLGVGDLFALANAIAAMVGGATTIENLQEQILAYSTLPNQPIDEDRRAGILGRQVPYLPENAGQYASVFRAEGAVHIEGVGDAMDRLAIAVRAGKQPLGSIWVVDADGTLDAEAKRALESAADIAALHMLRARSSYDLARQQRAELLRRLLESDDDSQLVAEQLALGRKGPFAVVAFAAEVVPGSEEIALARVLDLVSTQCEAYRQGTQCVMIGTTIYALFTEAGPGALPQIGALARRLIERAAVSLRLELRVALGTPVAAVGGISRSKYDADLVLLMLADGGVSGSVSGASGASGAPGGGFASAAEMRSRLTLLEVAALFRSKPRLMSPAAAAMLEHDARSGTDYAKTLRTYLAFSCDSAKTAQALSLHQNTLRYRLRRMEEIFGIDPAQAEDMLVLWLSLAVQELGSTDANRVGTGGPEAAEA